MEQKYSQLCIWNLDKTNIQVDWKHDAKVLTKCNSNEVLTRAQAP